MRKSIVIADDFYADPHAVRAHALAQPYYYPYDDRAVIEAGKRRPNWMSSRHRPPHECPFKSSPALVRHLERLTGDTIDRAHWNLGFPTRPDGRADPERLHMTHGCLWNACFHAKLRADQPLGEGVHNHVTDSWNSVGIDGWAGLIYLDPDAPPDSGVRLWRNVHPARQFDWMTPRQNWRLVDSLGNVFNRLLLVRGDVPHSGAAGWGSGVADGRLFQTFFFKITGGGTQAGVDVFEEGALHGR